MKKYITKQSNIKGAGKGLFTKAAYKKGEVIGLAHVDGQPTIEIGKNHNHNEKTPTANNVKNGNKRYLVASRNLQPGEEITTNYRLQPELEQPEDFQKKKGGNMTPQKDGYRTYSPFKKLPYIDVESNTIDSNNIVYDLNLEADNGLTKFVGKNTGLHTLPGAKIIREIPVKRKGGLISLPTDKPEKSKKFSRSLDATNRLFTENYLFKKPKSRKNKIFDPHAKYYAEGGEYEEAELTPEEIEAYRAEGYTVDDTEYKEGGEKNKCKDGEYWDGTKCTKLISYATDKKLIDGVSNWAMHSANPDQISSEYNDQIKHYLYSGKYGYDPVSMSLIPLSTINKKLISEPDQETKKILAKQDDKAAYTQSIIDAGFDPDTFGKSKGTNIITGEEIYGDKSQEDVDKINKEAVNDFVTEGHRKAILESPFNTAAFFTPAGIATGVMQGAANILPDAYDFVKDPSWSGAGAIGVDALMIAPGTKGLGKFLGTESGLLSNTYKINPWAFKANPNSYYRGIGRSGLDDALETQQLRTANKMSNFGEDLYLTSDFKLASGNYSKDKIRYKENSLGDFDAPLEKILPKDSRSYIAEIPKSALTNPVELPNLFVNNAPIIKNRGALPLDNIKLYKQHWRKGYQEVPKQLPGSPNAVFSKYLTPKEAAIVGSSQIPQNKYGGLNKFIEGGPNNCPNDMIWDAELQACIINAPINPNEEPINTYEFESMTPDQILARDAENLEKEQETWTDAQWDAYEKAEEVKAKAEAKIKAEEAYNKALINEPQYADEALNFVKGWHDSPMYNQMVLNSYKGNQKNADYLTKLRKKNIATIPAINIMTNQENAEGSSLDSSNVAAWSKSDTGQVEVFPAGFEYGPSLYAHEYLHSSDRPRELYDYDHPSYADGNSPDWMFYNDQRFPDDGLVMHGRVMPKSDQMYITNNRSSNWKDNENYKLEKEEGKYVPKTDEELKQEVIDSGFSLDDPLFTENFNAAKKQNVEDIKWSQDWNKKHWKEFGHDYISNPTETRARLGEIRLQAKKENIYDPYTEQITPEIFQNYINKKREDSNFAPMKPIDELRNEFTDEEILYMLQNISKNPNPQKEEEGAEGVMKYGGLHKFAGGAEVERPCQKGYIFDPIFGKCVTEMQYKITRFTKSNYNPANADKAIIENERYRKANNYLTAYYASPKYKEMLKRSSSSPENYNYIFKGRNKQLATTPPLLLLPQPEDSPNTGGQSYSSTGQIELFPEGYGTVGTAVHELSHSSDRPLSGDNRLMPASDKEYIRLHKAKVLGDSRDYHNDNEYYNYGDAQKDFQKFYTNYIGKDTETRARLNAIRQGAKQNGLYDPFTQGVSKDLYYKKLKNFNFEKGDKSGFDPMEQLKGAFSDEEIIWMLNNISKNKNKQEEGIVEGTAKKGGFIETELTPEEIERYRKEGYTIEELD